MTTAWAIKLARRATTASASVFLPADARRPEACEELFEYIVRKKGQDVLGWRDVPTDNSIIGPTAKSGEPVMRQIFIGRSERRRPTRRPSSGGSTSSAARRERGPKKRA